MESDEPGFFLSFSSLTSSECYVCYAMLSIMPPWAHFLFSLFPTFGVLLEGWVHVSEGKLLINSTV